MAAAGITQEQLTSWFSRKRRAQREITGEQPPKRKNQYPDSTRKYLNEWFEEHLPHPYLSEEDLVQIKAATDLTGKQIKFWLKNKRKQHKMETGESLSPKENTGSQSSQSTQSKSYLQDWFAQNSQYPTKKEKAEIMTVTGLSKEQIDSWFRRERAQQGSSTFRFPTSSVKYLNNWCTEHSTRPTKEEKEAIANDTGLTYQQVMSWFSNKRSAEKKANTNSSQAPKEKAVATERATTDKAATKKTKKASTKKTLKKHLVKKAITKKTSKKPAVKETTTKKTTKNWVSKYNSRAQEV
jgi:hypothetical protein